MQAEERLREGGPFTPDQAHELVLRATGDPAEADRVRQEMILRQLES